MRKPQRWITYILIMAIMVCSTAPVFAEAWTSYEAQQVTSDVLAIKTYLTNFFTTYNVNGGNVRFTFNDLASDVHQILHFVSPSFSSDTGLTLWDYLFLIGSEVNSLWSQWTSNFAQLNTLPTITTNTNQINDKNYRIYQALTNYGFIDSANQNSTLARLNSHMALLSNYDGTYNLFRSNTNGTYTTITRNWMQGSPIGNLALLLQELDYSSAQQYLGRWNADLTGYNAQLSVWDSQGNTLQQTLFTPQSAINGLYNYLAYTQRDVARLTYVLASDEEIAAREKARDNQNAVLDNFIDDTGDGAISTNDFGSVADASKDIKDNLNTGVSASGIFDVFTGNHTSAWFSQTTANELDRTQANRSLLKANGLGASDYDTPLLDEKMNELLSIFGGDDNK